MGASVGVGDLLAGKYRIEHELGSGGMGVVLAARHVDLDTRVAIKLMHGAALEDPQAAGRFLREARAAARLRGEHIARVTDYGKLESGEPYSVIEYLDGKDLAEVLRETELPIGHAVEYLCQSCEAIVEAHAQGIVHRDIKPSNLFLTRRPNGKPCVKVLDFGISKFTLGGEQSLELAKTSTKAVLGSPLYMSPEQMRASRDVDPRSDIWSLGATLYQLLTRCVPFTAETMMELCIKVANEDPPSLRSIRPTIPAPLEAAVLRCLERNPDDRFQTVQELADAIAPYAAAGRASAADIVVEARTSFEPGEAPASAADPSGPTRPNLDARSALTEELAPRLAATDSTWGKTQAGAKDASRRRSGWIVGAAIAIVGMVGWKLSGTEVEPESERAPASAAEPAPTPTPSVATPVVAPELSEPDPEPPPEPPPSASVAPRRVAPAPRPPTPTPPAVKSPPRPKSDDPLANPL